MVISMSIMLEVPIDTGMLNQDGTPVLRMVSMAPAYGACLVFRSVEEAQKLGVRGPFHTINVDGEDVKDEANPGLKLLH